MSFQIDVFSHNFSVKGVPPKLKFAVESFMKRFHQMGLVKEQGRLVWRPVKLYAANVMDGCEYRFHINCYNGFKRLIETFYPGLVGVTINVHQSTHGVPVELPVFEEWHPREEQIKPIEYLNNDKNTQRKFLEVAPGHGKTFMSLFSGSMFGKRIGIVVRSMYVNKWRDDVYKTYDIDPMDLIIVRGSESLNAVLEAGLAGVLHAKVILISNRTLYFWFKAYEERGDGCLDEYACLPYQMCEVLGIGLRLVDEAHQDFHFNFKLDLYTNVERSISLSATLLSNDAFMKNIYQFTFPFTERYADGAYDHHVMAYAVFYRFKKPDRIRTSQFGRNDYSHTAFEDSIMKYVPTAKNYLKLIVDMVDRYYIPGHKPGYKLLIFCGSKALCTTVRDVLMLKYPKFTVVRFVEGDPYENLTCSDIIVSTLQSAGTARDIDGLYVVIQTTALSSEAGNVQSLGRLRPMKDGNTPIFVYFNCSDIPKHIDYHNQKLDIFKDRVKGLVCFEYPNEI